MVNHRLALLIGSMLAVASVLAADNPAAKPNVILNLADDWLHGHRGQQSANLL